MERWNALNWYKKGILLLLAALIVIFFVVYSVVTSRVGFLYNDTILLPSQQDGNTVYSGKIDGKEAEFTVTAKKEITFRLGDKVYGPYTVREDPTAKPKDHPICKTGIEIKEGEKIIFRGGFYQYSSDFLRWELYNSDGTPYTKLTTTLDGIPTDENGNVIVRDDPSIGTLLDLYYGPKLTNKGNWGAWFLCVFLSIWTAVCTLFADELFRWYLRRRIADWQFAEPSEWEITSRYIGMTLMAVFILFLYIKGLQ